MKKKRIVLTAFLALTLSVTACSGKSNPSDTAPTDTEQTQTTEQTAQQMQPAETAAATDTAVTDTAGTETAAGTAESGTDETGSAADSTAAADTASEGTMTGVVDTNKGFMITIISDEDSEPYVFPLDDTQRETYGNLKAGDKVTVSYSNGIPSPDNLETVVTDIQKVK